MCYRLYILFVVFTETVNRMYVNRMLRQDKDTTRHDLQKKKSLICKVIRFIETNCSKEPKLRMNDSDFPKSFKLNITSRVIPCACLEAYLISRRGKKTNNYYKGGHIQYKTLQTVSVGLLLNLDLRL